MLSTDGAGNSPVQGYAIIQTHFFLRLTQPMPSLHQILPRIWQRRGVWAWLLWPLSGLYGALWRARQLAYRRGWRASGHPGVVVLVVGNVVAGGAGKTPTTLALVQHLRARGLQVGGWYMLDYRSRNEAVQLAWLGLRKQLSMFVTPQGRCVLFQQHRLAAFLQAGLLLPAQDEALSVRATRSALAKLDVDPGRLLN